jgi:hypothetical protein
LVNRNAESQNDVLNEADNPLERIEGFNRPPCHILQRSRAKIVFVANWIRSGYETAY